MKALLAFLMLRQVFACCLYLFRFSDEGFVLNLLRVARRSLMFLHSSVNHGLLFEILWFWGWFYLLC